MSGTITAARGVTGLLRNYVDLQETLDPTEGLQRRVFGASIHDPVQRWLRDFSDFQGRTGASYQPNYRKMGVVERGLTQGVESVPASLMALGSALAGAPAAGAALVGATVAGEAYRTGRESGLNVGRATTYGFSQGSIEFLGERIPGFKFLEDTQVGTGFFKRLARNWASEQITEQATTALQDLNTWAMIDANQGKTFADYLRERPAAALDTALAVTSSVGATNVTIGAAEAVGRTIANVVQARREAALLRQVGEDAATSTLRQRDPEAFADFLAGAAEGSPYETVFVSGEAIRQFNQAYREDPFFSAYADQIDEALAIGGDVLLPIGDVAARMPDTPAWDALREDLRFSQGGLSAREAEIDEADLLPAIDRAANSWDREQEAGRPRQVIFDRVAQMLMDAGRTPDAARQEAELVTARIAARADRLGKPLAGDELDNLEIRRVLPEGLKPVVAADNLAMTISAMRRARGTSVKPASKSLLEWISERGGIEDRGGDIASMGGTDWHLRIATKPDAKNGGTKVVRTPIRGRSKLIRPHVDTDQASMLGSSASTINAPDKTLADAIDAGYFPELQGRASEGESYDALPDVQTLFDAIDAELRGQPRYAEEVVPDQARLAADDLAQLLEQEGIDPATASDADIRSAVDRFQQESTNGRSYDQSLRSIKAGIRSLIAAAKKTGHNHKVVEVAAPSAWLIEQAAANGLSIEGLTHTVDTSAVRHMLNRHTNERIEASRGQIALTDDDFLSIPSVVANPDFVAFGLKNARGQDVIAYAKHMPDGTTLYFEEVREPAGQLAAASMRRFPGTNDARRLSAILAPHVRNASQGAPNIIEVPPEGKLRSFDQSYESGPRGRVTFDGDKRIIELFAKADLSTFVHESFHVWLEELQADASLPDAPDQLKGDWEAVAAWFASNGHPIGDDGSIPVDAHELWARAGERFVMEGRAPSRALQKAFDAFRSWLLSIYAVVERLRAPITPEVRDVMTRLLATDQEIAEAAEEQRIRALFGDAATAGMTEVEFAAYRESLTTARSEAHDALLYRTMSAVRARRTAEYREQRDRVRREVAEGVDARREWRAMRILRDRDNGVKLDRDWLVATYGADALDLVPKSVPPLYGEHGADAEMIAEMAGFATADDMVRMLMGIEERRKNLRAAGDQRSVRDALIDQDTDDIMADRYGDPLSDGTIEREARELIHNDQAGEVMAAELRVLARQRRRESDPNQAPTPYALAKRWAADKVRSGKVQDFTSRGAIDRFRKAARKAGSEAEQAILNGDVDSAFAAKQRQMLNSALVTEAARVADEIDKAVARLGKIAKRRTSPTIDQDYLEEAQALLEQVEMRPRSQLSIDRQSTFEAWAQAQEAEGRDIVVPPSFAASLGTTHWTRLTTEQLLGLDATVSQIIHLGRLKQKLLDGQDERDFQAVVGEAVAAMADMPHKPTVDGFLDPSMPAKAWRFVLGVDAAMLKAETIFGWLDNGNPNGVFNRAIFQRFVDAQETRRLRVKDLQEKLEAARLKVPEATRKRWSRKVDLGLIDPDTGRPAVMTGDQIIMLALNLGNEGNATKLAKGYGWNLDAIQAVADRELTKEEWGYVQDIWDIIDTLWPEIAALERRVNGYSPEKIEAREVSTPYGPIGGGYFPVVYDPTRNLEMERHASDDTDALFARGYRRATTRAGSTHERTEFHAPILLSTAVIDRHIGEVVHDLTHREAVIDANRFLNNPMIVREIREVLGVDIQKQLQPWLRHIANEWAYDAAGAAAIEKMVKGLRTNATFVGLAYRASTIRMQAAGLLNTSEVVGPRWIAQGVGQFAKAPIETTRMVLAMSKEVAARMETNDRDVRDAIKREQSKLGFVSNMKLFGFHLIGLADRFVSITSWVGAYNRALVKDGMTEDQAIAYADGVIRKSQGSGSAKDLAAIQRGKGNAGEAAKLLTMYYSYMSAFYQRQRILGRDTATAIRERDAAMFPVLLARTVSLYFLPALAAELLAGRGPDDDEDWTEWMLRTVGLAALGPIPIIRDIAGGVASGFGYNFSPASGLGRAVTDVIKDGARIVQGEETKKATKHALEAVGYATGYIPGQLATSTQFLVDVAYDEQDPETVADWWRGITTGKVEDE